MFIITKSLFYKKFIIFSIQTVYLFFSWISIILFYKDFNLKEVYIRTFLYISFMSLYSLYIFIDFFNIITIYRNMYREFINNNSYSVWYSDLYFNKTLLPLIGGFTITNGIFFSIVFLYTINNENIDSIPYIFFIQYTLISFISFLFVITLIIYYTYTKFYNNNNVIQIITDYNDTDNVNLDNLNLDNNNNHNNIVKYVEVDCETECCICLENKLEDNDKKWGQLICYHIFHIDCINKWLEQSTNCPICRT